MSVDLSNLLEEIQLNIRKEMWFMFDGAPAHFDLRVQNLLNETSRGHLTSTPWTSTCGTSEESCVLHTCRNIGGSASKNVEWD